MNSKELAKLLGVSPSAVSIALNGRKGISEKTRDTILAAAKANGIIPSIQLSTEKANFINLVIFKKHGQVYGDTAFFSELIEGISKGISDFGYKMQMTYFYGNQDFAEQMKGLNASDCAGIILLATEMDNHDMLAFEKVDKPMVVLDSYFEFLLRDCVVINNSQGSYQAARYLIDNGHSQLGYVHSKIHINNFHERYEGFMNALKENPEIDSSSVIHIDVGSTQETAYNDMTEYLESGQPIPKALFIDNDLIAISCIRALKEHHYAIPDDVSIIGFDDIPMSYVTSPKLTTIRVSKGLLGFSSVALLNSRLTDKKDSDAICMRIGTSLVLRDTVKKLN